MTEKVIEGLSLLELETRLDYIIDVKNIERNFFLKEIGTLIFYGINKGYSAAQSKNNSEQEFHKFLARYDNKTEEKEEDKRVEDPRSALGQVFR